MGEYIARLKFDDKLDSLLAFKINFKKELFKVLILKLIDDDDDDLMKFWIFSNDNSYSKYWLLFNDDDDKVKVGFKRKFKISPLSNLFFGPAIDYVNG